MPDLIKFPDPVAQEYRIGNNGEFDWTLPWVANCVQAACDYVLWQCGPAVMPMAIYDCADQDGDTPAGRHPGGAHDVSPRMGVNMDLGYYLLVDDGDPLAGSNDSGSHLTGFPDRLDVDRMAHWYAALAWQAVQAEAAGLTDGSALVRIAACDGQVLGPILARLGELGLAQATLDKAHAILHGEVEDQGTGWFAFHDNHTHVRWNYLSDDDGRLAALFQAREDLEWHEIKAGGATTPSPGVVPPPVDNHDTMHNGDHHEVQPPATVIPPAREMPQGLTVQSGYDLNSHDWAAQPVVILGPGAHRPFVCRAPHAEVWCLIPHEAWVEGSLPGPGGEPPNGARFMSNDVVVWNGPDLRGSEARGLRATDVQALTLRCYRSTGHGLEAVMVANCDHVIDQDSSCGDSLDTQTYEGYDDDQKHAKYFSGKFLTLICQRHRCFSAPGSLQLNGASLHEHIEDVQLEDFLLDGLGSQGTPALSLMAVSNSHLTRFQFAHDNADVTMFEDGQGTAYGCHNNVFTDFVSDHAGRFSVHEISSGNNTWENPQGFDIPDGDRLVAGTTPPARPTAPEGQGPATSPGPAPTAPTQPVDAQNPRVHPRGPWPLPPVAGVVVEMDPGAYGWLAFHGYAGATVRAIDPANTTVKDLEILDHCEGLRLQLSGDPGPEPP